MQVEHPSVAGHSNREEKPTKTVGASAQKQDFGTRGSNREEKPTVTVRFSSQQNLAFRDAP